LNKTVGPAAEQRRNQQKLQAAVAQSGTKSNRGNGSRARATLAASIVIVGIVLVAGAGYWRLHTTVPPAANLSQASNDGPVSVPDDQSKSPRSGTDWATPIQQPKAAAPKTIPLGTPDKTQEKPADNAAVGQLSASEVAYRKGWKFYSDNQYDQALPFLQQAAAGNNINAIETIAYMYHNGQGLKQDHQQWLKLTIRAAELGSRASMGELAAAYQKGSFGIPTDSELSLHWYRKLADAGGGEAMYRLGEFYETGAMGLKQDLDQAISWYRKAAASDAKFAPDWARRALKRLGK
jgi:TPR repeat protein